MWGSEDWGTLIWGGTVTTPVPLFSPLGLITLALVVLATEVIVRRERFPRRAVWAACGVVVAVPLAAIAGALTVPNTFTNGTIADADQVNANFAAVETEVGDNDARIAALEGGGSSVLYTRWGRSACPSGATLVYAGVAGGTHYNQPGSGGNLLCMSLAPTFNQFSDLNQNGALVYGVEYAAATPIGLGTVTGFEVPCAVCLRDGPSIVLQHPGSDACPAGFDLEYPGYLMANHYTQHSNEFVCVDQAATGIGSGAAANEGLLYPTEAECGTLPCGPYVQNRELTCSVCSR